MRTVALVMGGQRSESELLVLRKLAQELAHARKERETSGHLLAAIASRPSVAAELLLDRKLGADVLLKAARATTDEDPEPLARAVQRAREVAARCHASAPNALHLLIALTNDRSSGAHRALAQCGIDVARLRTSAMQIALGLVGPRRLSTPAPRVDTLEDGRPGIAAKPVRSTPPPGPRALSRPLPGVTVPVIPEPLQPASRAGTARPSTPPPAAPAPVVEPVITPHKKTRRVTQAPPPASSGLALDPKRFPALSTMGRNLTLAAAEGALEPFVGREIEIDQILDILAKRHANNACVLGPPGVGKTALVRGLAQRIAARAGEGLALDQRIIVEVPVAELIAGASRGSLAERMTALRNEAREAQGRVVLFFDDVHTLFGDLTDEATGELKLALARGELPCIGTSTPDEFRRVFDADPALARCFTVLELEEPSQDEALAVLRSISTGLERHHGLAYDERALAAAVAWSVRYLPGRALPDKAVGILDFAGARTRRRSLREVRPEAIAEIVSELAAIPVERLLETDRERMIALESILAERVVGHAAALSRIANILRRNAVGLRGKRPIGTFLLLGPTGVGKTETAKAIAEVLFHSADAMTRIDLGEYSEPHSVARLIGAPPGYLGHEAGGQLTEAVRKRPYQVILLDEIEKAHRDVLETFLGVFDEGRLTDGRGKTIDFTNTVLVLTSNLGAAEASARATRGIGFGRTSEDMAKKACDAVTAAARAALPPELYNRIDEVIAFPPLSRHEVAEVARRLLESLSAQLEEARDMRLDVDDAAVEVLLDAGGYEPELGARPMKRTIARLVEAPLADMVLRGELEPGDVVLLTAEDGKIVLDRVRPETLRH